MNPWKPACLESVRQLVADGVTRCNERQRSIFARYCIAESPAPIVRYGRREHVIIVARRGDEVIYWEDIDEGFNVSPIGEDGLILEHYCNQDELAHALNRWIAGNPRSPQLGPAQPID